MRSKFENVTVAGIFLLSFLVNAALPAFVDAHDSHPKRGKRVQQCGKADKQTKRVARHTTGSAVERYQIKELVTQEDFDRASREMNHFLRWKLGGKVAVCAQYVSTGYGHFEKAYSDEAAAMMLGVIHFKKQDPELYVPEWMITYFERHYGRGTQNLVWDFLSNELGLPKPLALQLQDKFMKALTDPVVKVANSVKAYVPKSYDVDNHLVEAAIRMKRDKSSGPPPSTTLTKKGGNPFQSPHGGLTRGIPDTESGSTKGKGPIGKSPPIGGSGTGTSPDVCEDPYSSEDCYCQAFPEDCAGGGQYSEDDFNYAEDESDRGRRTSEDYYESQEGLESEESFGKEGTRDMFSTGSDQGPLQSDVPWYEKLGGTGQ